MVAETILRKPTRHPRVLWSRLHYRWPFLIWVAAALAVGRQREPAAGRPVLQDRRIGAYSGFRRP